jgi:hypothetical protein
MRPGIEGSAGTVYVVMRGQIEKNPRYDKKAGQIVSVWASQEHALDEVDWFINGEIARSGRPLNDYWVSARGVLTMREDYIANQR